MRKFYIEQLDDIIKMAKQAKKRKKTGTVYDLAYEIQRTAEFIQGTINDEFYENGEVNYKAKI